MTEIERAIKQNTRDNILKWLAALRIEPEIPGITEWAERNRYLPEGTTERPGLFNPAFCSYLLEIQENFSLDAPYRTTSILKSTQSLCTTTIENVIGHSIKYGLHNILYGFLFSTINYQLLISGAALLSIFYFRARL